MRLEEIRPIAEKCKKILELYCTKIEIAGSIRREKADCGDIEICLVRDKGHEHHFRYLVDNWERIKGDPLGRYTQRLLPEGVKLDIFMAQEDNWGDILLIRTGNWKFSRFMMGIRAKQVGLLHREGYLWKDGVKLPCYAEDDVFKFLKMDWVAPRDREWE